MNPTGTRAVLVPYDQRESLSVCSAARIAGRAETTIKNWCEAHAIGRKVGGRWEVSKVALAMYLDGNAAALAAYHEGDRTCEAVLAYFRRPLTKTTATAKSTEFAWPQAGLHGNTEHAFQENTRKLPRWASIKKHTPR